MIDSHCHLDHLKLDKYPTGISAALTAARNEGVRGFLCIGIGFDNAQNLIALEQQHDDVWLSMGVHPLDEALGDREQQRQLAHIEKQLRQWCSLEQVVAVGETGLDYFYMPETKEAQLASFELHLKIAQELQKPVVIHTRHAEQETLELMQKYAQPKSARAGVLHCFTESWEMAQAGIDMGYYISISGIVTFANAENVKQLARSIPLDKLLIETDSPYLAPVPFRGKPNEPSYLPKVAQCIAELKKISLEQLVEATTHNFNQLFLGIP